MLKIKCLSSVYGEDFHKASFFWYQRNSRFLPEMTNFNLVSLDGKVNKKLTSFVDYSQVNLAKDNALPGWGDGDLPRLKKITELCSDGSTCVHLDLDLVLLKDVTPVLNLPYDLIISRAFAFPKSSLRKLGFVACTGFYIAKPESLPLLNFWIRLMEEKSQVDQRTLNKIIEDLSWSTIKINIDNMEFQHNISSWNNISILVLDSEVLPRGMKKQNKKSYGIHNPKVMEKFWGIK